MKAIEVNYDKFIDDGVGLIIHPSEQTMTDKYYDDPEIVDETFEQMVDTVEAYIELCALCQREMPYLNYDPEPHMAFAPVSDYRWELLGFQPEFDSIYTTPAVANRIMEKYPNLVELLVLVR